MGVTDLWEILAPAKRDVKLEELRGQTLAVDLSIWVVEAEGVARMKGIVVRPYLRNLFFRIWHLQQHGIKPVFVIEGKAPELKHETMARRQQARSGGPQQTKGAARGNRGGGGGGGSRSYFKIKLRECCNMLDSLGIAYVQSKGEAEALCALLTMHGKVDGCITNDGDTFLYGATTVYRNFSTSDKRVEVYKDVDIKKDVGLSRDNLVALSLLLGCDFCPGGVPGVGKVRAMELINEIETGESLLDRFQQWKREETSIKVGSVDAQVRRKALNMPDFPQEKVVEEFTQPKDNVENLRISWNRPNMFDFQKFMVDKAEWSEKYALEKVLPVLTLYDMMAIKEKKTDGQWLFPHSIVKSKVKQGVPMYEIEWNKAPSTRTTTATTTTATTATSTASSAATSTASSAATTTAITAPNATTTAPNATTTAQPTTTTASGSVTTTTGDPISEGEFYVTEEKQSLVDACYKQLVKDYTLSLENAKKGKPSRKKKGAAQSKAHSLSSTHATDKRSREDKKDTKGKRKNTRKGDQESAHINEGQAKKRRTNTP